jgi:tryptophan synthase alpha chain
MTTTKLSAAFTPKAFIPYLIAGDPDIETTISNIQALTTGGADAIELGIPFSDPVADGPDIQAGDLRAFAAGISIAGVFDIVAAARKFTDVPFIFVTYANIPFKFGYDAFCARCSELNVAGLIIPDLPLEEQGEIRPSADKYGISIIETVPVSSESARVAALAAPAEFALLQGDPTGVDLGALTASLKQAGVRSIVGLGSADASQAAALAASADGVSIDTTTVQLIANQDATTGQKLTKLAETLSAAVHGA